MKKYIYMALCCTVLAIVASSCGNNSNSGKAQASTEVDMDSVKVDSLNIKETEKVKKTLADLAEEPIFDIVTNYGTIKVKLYADTPLHRANFAKLALDGFYDGLLFHRVIKGFMIQGGDPLTKNLENMDRFGSGGPGYTVPAEFVAAHKHKKGALAAARRGDQANPKKESSGSQFYIVQDARTCAQLDGQYTVFGETIEGLDVIDKIASVQTDRRDRPVAEVKIINIKAE